MYKAPKKVFHKKGILAPLNRKFPFFAFFLEITCIRFHYALFIFIKIYKKYEFFNFPDFLFMREKKSHLIKGLFLLLMSNNAFALGISQNIKNCLL